MHESHTIYRILCLWILEYQTTTVVLSCESDQGSGKVHLHVGEVLGKNKTGEDVYRHGNSALKEDVAVVQDVGEVELGEVVPFMVVIEYEILPQTLFSSEHLHLLAHSACLAQFLCIQMCEDVQQHFIRQYIHKWYPHHHLLVPHHN